MNAKFKSAMVIDDNQIDLYIASRVISKTKFADNILTYTSAADALQYLKEHEHRPMSLPEILFVDIYMPGMSGFEFMQAFASLSETIKKHCHAYIVSSTIDENDIERTKKDPNIMGFQEKPINNEFLDRIAS